VLLIFSRQLLLSRRPAAGIAAATMLTAIATTAWLTDAIAAEPNRPATVQRTTPFQPPAPAFHPAPVQNVPPHAIVSPPTHPVRVMPTFAQPQKDNFQAVSPSAQHDNPSLPFNGASALRPNRPVDNASIPRPNLPLDNPSALRPNLPANDAGAIGLTPPSNIPNFVQRSGIAPQGPVTLRPGPSQSVNPTLLRPAAGGFSSHIKPGFPAVHLRDKFWPIHKDSKFIWVRGQRRLFVPVALLGVVLIGGSYWYPDGYVSMEGPVCTGFTPEGCQLQWRMVDFEDGGGEPQCVQYCPQVGPPPAQVATLPPPPPPSENGACQTTIYAEPNFAGNSAPTDDNQPNLSQTGWRDEISSIVVGAGMWDFFSDENFGGESLRLTPGTYPTLSAEWTKRIGSFMCVQPGPPPA